MIRTGIFGGSYNPIHIGHLALANYLCEYGELDELWFMVSPQNPFKAHSSDLWDDNLRLELVRLAVEGYPKLHASDFEFHMPRPSYTVNTLEKLREAYPDREFILIIGADNWLSFPRWKDADIIMKQEKNMNVVVDTIMKQAKNMNVVADTIMNMNIITMKNALVDIIMNMNIITMQMKFSKQLELKVPKHMILYY